MSSFLLRRRERNPIVNRDDLAVPSGSKSPTGPSTFTGSCRNVVGLSAAAPVVASVGITKSHSMSKVLALLESHNLSSLHKRGQGYQEKMLSIRAACRTMTSCNILPDSTRIPRTSELEQSSHLNWLLRQGGIVRRRVRVLNQVSSAVTAPTFYLTNTTEN